MGVFEALTWIQNDIQGPVTLESDSLITVHALQKTKGNQLEVGHILDS